MSANTPTFDIPLEAASRELHDLFDGDALPPGLDRGSIGRILIHIDNISRSVIASKQDHPNAAKRLRDFALVFTRIALNSRAPDATFAARVTCVATNLRAASRGLADGDDIRNGPAATG